MLKIEPIRFIKLNKKSNIRLHAFCHYFEQSEIPAPSEDTFLLIYLKKGFVKVELDGEVCLARSGDIIALPGKYGTGVCLSVNESPSAPTPDYYVLSLSNLSAFLPEKKMFPIVKPGIPPEIISAKFQLLESELMSQREGWIDICASELMVLMRLIFRDVRLLQPAKTTALSRSDLLLNNILDYIRAHYCEKLSLQSVADRFFISPYYLSHLFERKKGVSLMQYVTRLRMHEAKMLLRTTDYSVKQIANMTGYQSVNYFFNAFKVKEGCTPSQYRARVETEEA